MSDYKEKFEKMRVAGKLAAQTLDMLTDNIKEGVSTDHIDKLGYEFIRDNGGYSAPLYYRGFAKSLCTSLNHVVCHGIPSDRILRDGDAINVDVTAIVDDVISLRKASFWSGLLLYDSSDSIIITAISSADTVYLTAFITVNYEYAVKLFLKVKFE